MSDDAVAASAHQDGVLKYIDSIAKLLAACAIVVASFIAARYESRTTSLSLLNQREQSESQLRASMFQNLIDPIVGRPSGSEPISAEREQLLVELLTLNFHGHFEFKPILLDVDNRLVRENLEPMRDELSSVARRVLEREINTLNVAQLGIDGHELSVRDFSYREPADASSAPPSLVKQEWTSISPDKLWEVKIALLSVDFAKRTARVSVNARQTTTGRRMGLDFELTQFDFPITDYRQLDNDHRISLSMFEIKPKQHAILIKLVWFPRGYVTERERPFDYRSIKKAVTQP